MKLNESSAEEADNVLWACVTLARGIENSRSVEQICLLAYVAYLIRISEGKISPMDAVAGIENKLVVDSLSELVSNAGYSEAIIAMAQTYDVDEIKAVILSNQIRQNILEGQFGTPDELCKLALRILDIKKGDTVADLCCGRGNFLVDAMKEKEASEYYGVELNKNSAALASIRVSLISENCVVENKDAFECLSPKKFDKAFADSPMGMKTSQLSSSGKYAKKIRKGQLEYSRPYFAGWAFSQLLYDSIEESGKAICVITTSSASTRMDEEVRSFFVKNGMIEAVIALPHNLYRPFSGASVLMVVLSHGNDDIRLIDATDLCTDGRRKNTMAPEQIDAVIERLRNNGKKSRLVGIEELADNNFDLSPLKYFEQEIPLENPTPLGDVIKKITRGASLRASELDDLVTRKETGIKYLMLSDISDGRISGVLPSLKKLDQKLEKCCLRDGDLLISKNGKPFKVAIVSLGEKEKVLANGNLYIVRADESKVDPHYLLAYLRSKSGREYLKRASVGTSIPSISLKNLKELPVPLISLERQEAIGNLYQAKIDEIELLKMHIRETREEADLLFDEAVCFDIVDL